MRGCLFFSVVLIVLAASCLRADEPKKSSAGPNRADEPLRSEFSLAAAGEFLDSTSVKWFEANKCFTCHTNFYYLMARPSLSFDAPNHLEVRKQLEEMVEKRWVESGPRWDAEVVMAAAVLAQHDAATTKKLHATTRKALDRSWSLQREDGGFSWLKCDWPPMESDDHYGATMALIGVGAAPEGYAKTEKAVKGVAGLKKYLAANPAPTLHHQLMVLWANKYFGDLATTAEREETIANLLALQRPDGGWAVASMGDWKRGDGKPQDRESSDGYGTGLAIYVLKQVGKKTDDPAMAKGIEWLKTHQRESGRWYTRSLFKDGKHYLSHAGTAMAVLALRECGVE